MSAEADGTASLPTDAHTSERLLREGVVAGIIGAATIAIWFLILDAIEGRPLYTPTVLGTALVQRGRELTPFEDLPVSLGMVLLYTVVHGLGFCILGYVAVRLFVAAEGHAPLMFGLLLFSIFFFCGFLTVVFLFALPVLEALTIPAIVGGNILAALVMGGFLWRRHPLDLRKLL